MITPILGRVSRVVRGTIVVAPFIKLPTKTPAFAVKFAVSHFFTFTTSMALQEPLNPLQKYNLKRWETRQEPLWTSFVCVKDAAKKVVVKTVLQRRVKGAFRESMRKYGYAQDGTRLKAMGNGNNMENRKRDLVGTAQFMVERHCLKTKHEDLQKQMDDVVQVMIDRQKFIYGDKKPRGPMFSNTPRKEGLRFSMHT